MFAGVWSERERHIDIMTRAFTFTAAFTKKAVLNGSIPNCCHVTIAIETVAEAIF